jgi:hypothetical protein
MTVQTSAPASAAKISQVSVLHYHRLSKMLDGKFSAGIFAFSRSTGSWQTATGQP